MSRVVAKIKWRFIIDPNLTLSPKQTVGILIKIEKLPKAGKKVDFY